MSIVAIDVHPQRAFSEMCPDEVPVADALSIVPHLNRQASWADFRVLTKDAHVPDAGWIVPQQSDHLPLEQAEKLARSLRFDQLDDFLDPDMLKDSGRDRDMGALVVRATVRDLL